MITRDRIVRIGEIAGAITAVFVVLGGFMALAGADMPPYEPKAKAVQIAQSVEALQSNQAKLQESQRRSDQISRSLALIIYQGQLNQAQVQIDAAARLGKRDLAAEALKANAQQAISALSSQQP